MKNMLSAVKWPVRVVLLVVLSLVTRTSFAQQNIVVDLSPIDGVSITPDNILNFRLQSIGGSSSNTVLVKGSIRYRNSPINLSYSFRYTLKSGMNTISADLAHPTWQFSTSALRELFFNYKLLPEGTYEYCVTVAPVSALGEVSSLSFDECLYHRSDDVFLINLLEPENKAKLHEYNPMLSWIANYSFSNELTYRIKVSEIKQGQNPSNAVMRNQPVYDENNLMQNSIVYPIYAKPLVKDQPYAWTVDAYFKGILLGGSETWQFIILDDSVIQSPPASRSFVDIRRENGKQKLYAIGQLKLKYQLEKYKNDSLTLHLFDDKNQEIKMKQSKLAAQYGDNRYVLDFIEDAPLKHMREYNLLIQSKSGERFTIPFEYLNPDFVR